MEFFFLREKFFCDKKKFFLPNLFCDKKNYNLVTTKIYIQVVPKSSKYFQIGHSEFGTIYLGLVNLIIQINLISQIGQIDEIGQNSQIKES